jgi:DNA-binding transcriptional MerR regulator
MAIEKKYYSISEVAKLLGVNQSKIRYWESEFSQFVKPRRSRRGDRMFSPKDIDNLKLIKYLVEDLGFKLNGAKQYLKHHKEDMDHKILVIKKLEEIKRELEDLRDSIE